MHWITRPHVARDYRSADLFLLMAPFAFVAALLVGTIAHELAHAFVAIVTGHRVERICIGVGPLLLETQIGATRLELRPVPGTGMVEVGARFGSDRISLLPYVAAGPLCDILLLSITIMVGEHMPATALTNATVVPIVLAQALTIIGNLWPRRVSLYGRRVPNDGLLIWQILRSPGKAGTAHAGYIAMLSQYLADGQALPALSDRSAQIARLIATRFGNPGEISLETVSLLRSLLSSDLPGCEEVAILDTLVTSLLATDEHGLDADLDRWSARAVALAPDIVTLRGSRGAVLIRLGRHGDGLATLADAENGKPFNDCLVHAYRASGQFRLGDSPGALRSFEQSMALYRHDEWRGLDVERIVVRIAEQIGARMWPPSTTSR